MLYRKAEEILANWKRGGAKKAFMLTGARQTGKTTLVRAFAREQYKHFAEINFLLDSDACSIFNGSLDADTLVTNLTAYLRQPLEPGHTLVLFDEIQECPRARTAIKALVEDGRFSYVETGSLLGVRSKEVPSYPVGFEEIHRLHPMDFEEFCLANGVQRQVIDHLRECFDECKPVDDAVHQTMMRLFSLYVVVGGMPEVVQRYVDTQDIAQVVAVQRDLLALYRQDIAKYADNGAKAMVRTIFDAIPAQLDDKNRRFVLASLAKSARSGRYESSFLWLSDAGVTLPCYNVTAPVAPLRASEKRSLFRLFMGDVGLLCASSLDNVQHKILQGDLDANLGSITENAVAQELAAHNLPLHYYNDKHLGEVDFVTQRGSSVLPIEVKSGRSWRRHAALNNMLAVELWGLRQGYVLCRGNVERVENVTYLPLYMTMFIEQERLPQTMPFVVDLSAMEEFGR